MKENEQSSLKFFDGKTEKLQNLCNSITDCDHSTPEWTETGKIVVRNFNIKSGRLLLDKPFFTNEKTFVKRTARSKPEAGDLIITREAPMGEVCVIPEGLECCLGQRVVLIKPDSEKVDSIYLLYVIQSEFVQKQIKQSEKTGSIVSNLRIPDLKNILIPVTKHQQKIAAVLSSLDSKIELNNKINAELEAMAKTLYDYWFVQFDFPDKDGKPYKTSGSKMVWNDELKREIPDGWEVGKIGSVFNTYLGGTPSTSVPEYWDNGTISWLNSGEIANFPIIDSELKITKAAIGNSATTLLPKGSVLLSITRHLRPSVLAVDACANQSVVGIKEKEDFRYYYLYPYLQNEIPRLNTMRSGAQQPHINKEIVDESLIVIPNSSILKMYNSKVAHTYEFIMNNAFQNQTLSELRDWLLPMLMNGQVTVT